MGSAVCNSEGSCRNRNKTAWTGGASVDTRMIVVTFLNKIKYSFIKSVVHSNYANNKIIKEKIEKNPFPSKSQLRNQKKQHTRGLRHICVSSPFPRCCCCVDGCQLLGCPISRCYHCWACAGGGVVVAVVVVEHSDAASGWWIFMFMLLLERRCHMTFKKGKYLSSCHSEVWA